MRTAEIAPGSILQQMYFHERTSRRSVCPGRFVDLGAGTGHTSSVLLAIGWQGCGVDLNQAACTRNSVVNEQYVAEGSYHVRHGDFLAMQDLGHAQLVVSSMVLEHLDQGTTEQFFNLVRSLLDPSGVLILMVPGSPRHWGIEDEIAGHVRRFTRNSLVAEIENHGFHAQHVVGLTYPISNLLLPISNFVVSRSERQRLSLTETERTVLAGHRQVLFKTSYPRLFHWFLNSRTLYPLHLLQKAFRRNRNTLVLYAEACL